MLFALKSGVRREECVTLEWTDWNPPFMHVHGTKTDWADRDVPITDLNALRMLERRKFIGGKYIFATRTGKHLHASALLKYMQSEMSNTPTN